MPVRMLDPTGSTGRASDAEWQAESWRLSAFAPSVLPVAEQNWWMELVGQAPEAEQANRLQGVFQAHGRFERGRLILGVQLGRVDWLYSSIPIGEEVLQDGVPTVGPAGESFEALRRLVVRWFAVSPPINRLAVGAVLTRPVASRQEAYRIITDYVPGLHLDTEGCSDFLYQINRPRISSVHSGLLINRLAKWSAAAVGLLGIMPADPTHVLQRDLYTVTRLELDINTAAGFQSAFSASELPDLVAELGGMGLEISEQGDIP
jgi:hypothetical protein